MPNGRGNGGSGSISRGSLEKVNMYNLGAKGPKEEEPVGPESRGFGVFWERGCKETCNVVKLCSEGFEEDAVVCWGRAWTDTEGK